jgi:hypothetical protein
MDVCSCRNRNIIIGIIACFFIAGIPAAMAADGPNATPSTGGKITVITFPKGATVYLNGEYRGVTPIQLENLSPAMYVVDISMAGYRNETVRRTLNEGSMLEIGINLEPLSSLPAPTGSGSIAVDSSPGGASVLLDGKPAGMTPVGRAALILNNIPAGSHTITVELAGYPPYTSTVTVIKNQVVKVSADFTVTGATTPGTPVPTAAGPAISGTPVATTAGKKTVPLSPLTAVAAGSLAGLAWVFRRS